MSLQSQQETISPFLCIPRIPSNVSQREFTHLIERTQIGHVQQYREIPLKQEPSSKRVIFKVKWNQENPNLIQYQQFIKQEKTLKLVYDFPWYWLIFVARQQHQ